MFVEILKYIPSVKEEIQFRIGKNAEGNNKIIELSCETDIWFHIGGNRSSGHVIASIPENISKKQKRDIIIQGACLCRQFSKYKSESQLEIIYTKLSDVIPTEIPGRVIAHNQKTIVL